MAAQDNDPHNGQPPCDEQADEERPHDVASPGDSSNSPSESLFVMGQSQGDFEQDFFHRVLRRSENNVDVLRALAESYAQTGQYEKSLCLISKLANLRPRDFLVRYNLACTLAMTNRVEESIALLAMAIELGYDDFVHMQTDPDLEATRKHPKYLSLFRLPKHQT